MHVTQKTGRAGFTLVEVMMALLVAVIFFASIFQINAMCLRSIGSAKESLAALQSVQDRAERLRNLAFADLTTPSVIQNLLALPANPAVFLGKATEVVTISNYPSTPNGVSRFTRSPGGNVMTNSVATDLSTGLVKVDVSISWTMTLGGASRSEQTSTLISNGTKK